MIREKVRAFCEKYSMLPPGTSVLCACSGGADSTALLHLLCSEPDLSVACAHFNHRLRGAESDRDEAFVRSLCASLGVECICASGDVSAYAEARRIGIEEAARLLRYDFLETTALERGFDRIATAHQAEDNAETVLLNLSRGSGMRGLCGIPPVRGRIIRPFLCLTRTEILEYLAEQGLKNVEDRTNGYDDCARNRIRHHVLPLLSEENSDAARHIFALTELLRRDEEYLSGCAEDFIEENLKDGALPIPLFLSLPEPIGTRVLRLALGQLSSKHVESVYALCRSDRAHGAADLPGRRIEKDRDRLLLDVPQYPPLARREIPMGETLLPELGLRIIRRPLRPGEEIHNSFNTFFFQCDLIRGMICVASRHPGDKVRLLGRGCTKTLKKLFAETQMQLHLRRRTPVLYDEAGVIAVYGFGVAERCAAVPGGKTECIEIREIMDL